ncbi:PREDICTED: mitochondrial import inner membrane translocase subunit Tim13-like [Fragaria vesca subsp. vesca]
MELSSGSSSIQFNPDQFRSELQSQIAEAYYQEFLETLRKKCFEKCITKPGSSLSGGESSCITKCIDLYVEATTIITKELVSASRD